jgi:hypothetical protein
MSQNAWNAHHQARIRVAAMYPSSVRTTPAPNRGKSHQAVRTAAKEDAAKTG